VPPETHDVESRHQTGVEEGRNRRVDGSERHKVVERKSACDEFADVDPLAISRHGIGADHPKMELIRQNRKRILGGSAN